MLPLDHTLSLSFFPSLSLSVNCKHSVIKERVTVDLSVKEWMCTPVSLVQTVSLKEELLHALQSLHYSLLVNTDDNYGYCSGMFVSKDSRFSYSSHPHKRGIVGSWDRRKSITVFPKPLQCLTSVCWIYNSFTIYKYIYNAAISPLRDK